MTNAHHFSDCINHARRTGFPGFAQAMTDLFLATATPQVLRDAAEPSPLYVQRVFRGTREPSPAIKRAAVKASFSASPWVQEDSP